jgi:hypothetical protein
VPTGEPSLAGSTWDVTPDVVGFTLENLARKSIGLVSSDLRWLVALGRRRPTARPDHTKRRRYV